MLCRARPGTPGDNCHPDSHGCAARRLLDLRQRAAGEHQDAAGNTVPPDQVRDNSRPDCLPAPVLAFEPVQHPRGTPSESGYPLGPDRPAAGELGAAGAKLRGGRQAHRRTGRTHCTSPRLRIPATGFTRPGGSIATSKGGIYTFPAVRGRPAEAMGHSLSSNRTVGSTTSIEPRSRAATGVRSPRTSGGAGAGTGPAWAPAAVRPAEVSPLPGSRTRPA